MLPETPVYKFDICCLWQINLVCIGKNELGPLSLKIYFQVMF